MTIIYDLEKIIQNRKSSSPETSWTAKLLSKGPDKAAEKFGEEAVEAIIEAVKGDKEALTNEAADVVYHLLVMLAAHNISFENVEQVLKDRQSQSGIAEKASR